MKNVLQKRITGFGALAIAVISVVGAGAAWAMQGGGHGRFMNHMIAAKVEEAEDFIDATPQQRQVIDAAKDDAIAKIHSRHEARAQHADEIITALTAEKLDADKLYQLADQHASQIRELAKDLMPDIQKVHDVLTPAQREKLAVKARELHARHHE